MKRITVKVEGMMCPMCEAHTNEAVKAAMKVKKVSSSHKDGETVIIAEEYSEDSIKRAIEETGYKVLGIDVAEEKSQGFFARLFKK